MAQQEDALVAPVRDLFVGKGARLLSAQPDEILVALVNGGHVSTKALRDTKVKKAALRVLGLALRTLRDADVLFSRQLPRRAALHGSEALTWAASEALLVGLDDERKASEAAAAAAAEAVVLAGVPTQATALLTGDGLQAAVAALFRSIPGSAPRLTAATHGEIEDALQAVGLRVAGTYSVLSCPVGARGTQRAVRV